MISVFIIGFLRWSSQNAGNRRDRVQQCTTTPWFANIFRSGKVEREILEEYQNLSVSLSVSSSATQPLYPSLNHISKMTSTSRPSSICHCRDGLAVLCLSNPVFHICRQVIHINTCFLCGFDHTAPSPCLIFFFLCCTVVHDTVTKTITREGLSMDQGEPIHPSETGQWPRLIKTGQNRQKAHCSGVKRQTSNHPPNLINPINWWSNLSMGLLVLVIFEKWLSDG